MLVNSHYKRVYMVLHDAKVCCDSQVVVCRRVTGCLTSAVWSGVCDIII